jgi:uncharacterized membrane protein
MKGHQFNHRFSNLEILREIKNSHYFLDSWTQFNSVGSFIHIFSLCVLVLLPVNLYNIIKILVVVDDYAFLILSCEY